MKTIDILLQDLSESRKRELLEELSELYNGSSSNTHLYNEVYDKYRELLGKFGYRDRLHKAGGEKGEASKIKNGADFWPGINFFSEWGQARLLILRLKALADTISEALNSQFFKKNIDKAAPGLSILGILWHVPRFLRHTALILKHLTSNEKSHSDYLRKFWFEWLNDAVAIAAGIVTLGISTGWFLAPLAVTLGPGGIALIVGVYAFEIFTLAAKAYTKIQKINRIIKNVNENIQTTCAELGLEATSGIQALRRQIAEIEQQFTIKSTYFSKLGIMDRSSKLDEKKLKIIINKKEQVQKLKNLIEIKEKVTLKKSYLLHDQLSKVGIATALFAGITLALTGPIGAAIGASLVVLTCTVQYWVNHHYLPKKEVQLAYDPLELLHAKLNKHTHTQLEALTKKISHLVDGLEKQQTLEKITAYRKSQTALNDWKETPVKECKKLYQAMNLVMNASKIRRNRDVTPASYKALKTDIKHFFTSWRNEYKEQQDEFYVIAQKFVLSSKTTDQASLKIDIVSEVTTGSCLFFAKAEGTNTTQAQAYAFGGSVAPSVI